MLQDILQEERWAEISEFPGYFVSNRGDVINKDSGRILKVTTNSHGCPMVGLMKNAIQYKRSLPVLVARAFLSKPHNEQFDTPIHLDGDRLNCQSNNLMWRPLWFSRKYMRQFIDGHTTYAGPVEDVETGERYDNSMDASMANGILDAEIVLTMYNNGYVWPTGQVFRRA